MPLQGPLPVQLHQGRVRAEQVRQPQVLPGLLLQLNFQACIDVAGSESATEELQCLATWSEGSKNYLEAEMNREHVYSDESKYRCFVYEKYGKGDNRTVQMAQSLTASCTGLWSPQEGYRTFDMEKGEQS